MTGARAVRCRTKGCCFATLKRADDDSDWWCPEHRPWEPGIPADRRSPLLDQLDATDPPTPEGHPTP